MLSFLLKDCSDCDSLEDVICRVDATLAQYGKDGWHNITYMTQKSVPNIQIKRLIYYRQILETLKWSQATYCPRFSLQQIISRAQAISNSISPIVRRITLPTYTTTTTTSTTSTTSTSTTSTTTSTTTHTTSTTSTTSTTTTTTSTLAPSTWSLAITSPAAATLTIQINSTPVVNQNTTLSGSLGSLGGKVVSTNLAFGLRGVYNLTVTDVTSSTVIENVTQTLVNSGPTNNIPFTFTGTANHRYTINATATPLTTTTTTTTSTTHTTSTTTTTTTT